MSDGVDSNSSAAAADPNASDEGPFIDRPEERMCAAQLVSDSLESVILRFEESNVVYFAKHALLNMSADQSDLVDGMLAWCQLPENADRLRRLAAAGATADGTQQAGPSDAERAEFLLENPYTCDTIFVVSSDASVLAAEASVPAAAPRATARGGDGCGAGTAGDSGVVFLMAHRAVLTSRSQYFANLLGPQAAAAPLSTQTAVATPQQQKKPYVVRRTDVSLSALLEVIRFMYSGMVNARRRDVIAVMSLAAELDLEDMVDACGAYLLDKIVDTGNACAMLELVCRFKSDRCALFVEHISQFIGEKAVECLGLTSEAVNVDRLHEQPLDGMRHLTAASLSHLLQHAPYLSLSEQIMYLLCLEWAKDQLGIPRETPFGQLAPEQHKAMHDLLRGPLRYVAFEAMDENFLSQVASRQAFANRKLIAAARQHAKLRHAVHGDHLIGSAAGTTTGTEDPMYDMLSAIHDRSRTFRFELVVPVVGKYESPVFVFAGLRWRINLVAEIGGWDAYLCLVEMPPGLALVLVDFVLYLINRSGKGHRIHSVDDCKFKTSDMRWSHQYQMIDSANVNNPDVVAPGDRTVIVQCAFNKIQLCTPTSQEALEDATERDDTDDTSTTSSSGGGSGGRSSSAATHHSKRSK